MSIHTSKCYVRGGESPVEYRPMEIVQLILNVENKVLEEQP